MTSDFRMNVKPRAVLIGAGGKQGREYLHLLKHDVIWVAAAERNPEAAQSISSYATKVVPSWQQLLSTVDFDVAVVAVPHHMHFEITKALLEAGRHVVKEKPFAITPEDAQELAELARKRGKSVYTIVQRQFSPEFCYCVTALEALGKPFWFNYQYHINLDAPTQGWRASPEMSHGGVFIDMGYHALDVVVRMFGPPDDIQTRFGYCFRTMRHCGLEDTADVSLSYEASNLQGTLHISRHHYRKIERLEILCQDGAVLLSPPKIKTFRLGGEKSAILENQTPKLWSIRSMFLHYFANLDNAPMCERHLEHHTTLMALMQKAYASARQSQVHQENPMHQNVNAPSSRLKAGS